MNRILLVLSIFAAALLLPGCVDEDDEMMEPSSECTEDATLEAVQCILGSTQWKIESIRSDEPRTDSLMTSSNWMEFRFPCHRETMLLFDGATPLNRDGEFITSPVAGDTILSTAGLIGDVFSSNCDLEGVAFIETTDFLSTANVSISEAFSVFVYGFGIPMDQVIEDEVWRDINYSPEKISYTVTKTIDDQSFEVQISLKRSR